MRRSCPCAPRMARKCQACPTTRCHEGDEVVSPQAAYIVTDILAGNTDPAQNPVWGTMHLTSANGRRRPAALKTGTNNDAKDLSAYGFIAPPTAGGRKQGEYALAMGVWMGNSDASPVGSAADPVFSLDTAGPLWQAVMNEVTRDWRVNDFAATVGHRQRPGRRVHRVQAFPVLPGAGRGAVHQGHDPRRRPVHPGRRCDGRAPTARPTAGPTAAPGTRCARAS